MKINKDIVALLIILAVGALFYQVVLTHPIVFGDEGFYASVGRWITENSIYPKYNPYHQTEIFHMPLNNLPFSFHINAFMWLLLGELGIKLIIPLFSILSALMLYLLIKRYDNWIAAVSSAFILLMLPGLATYGVLAYTETAMILFFISSIYFGMEALEKGSKSSIAMAGAFLGLSALTDLTGAVAAPVLLLYLIVTKNFKSLKPLAAIFLIALVMFLPFLARNLIMFGGTCYTLLPIGSCENVIDTEIPKIEGLQSYGELDQVSTGAGILQMGLQNYISFAFGWPGFALFLIGLIFMLSRRGALDRVAAIWIIFMLFMIGNQILFGGRSEDVPRFTLFAYPAVAIAGGVFLGQIYKSLESKKIVAVLIIVVLLLSVWIYGQQKLETMKGVKSFVPSFIKACEWVKENTEKESTIYAIYAHQGSYQCDRKVQSMLPDTSEIVFTQNDTSYEHLKLHGFDYVFIEGFTLTVGNEAEKTPLKFLNYLESSDKFKQVYDNRGEFGQQTGIIIYQVL